MSAPLVLAFLWVLLAAAIALMPRRLHWPGAVVLILLGVPLLGWLTAAHGPLAGLVALAAGASTLRWPLIHLGRWLRQRTGSRGRGQE